MPARWSRRIALGTAVLGILVVGLGLLSGKELLSWWRVQRLLSHRVFDTSILVESASPIDPSAHLVSVSASGETYWNGERVGLDGLAGNLANDAETGLCTTPILLELEADVRLESFSPVLEHLIVRQECVTLGLLVSTDRDTGCAWLDVPFAGLLAIIRGGASPERVDLADVNVVAWVTVSFATDGDLLVLEVLLPSDIMTIGSPRPPSLRVESTVWSQMGVVRALAAHPKVSQLPVEETTFVFSIRADPEVTMGHVTEFVAVVRSTFGDRGFVTFQSQELDY